MCFNVVDQGIRLVAFVGAVIPARSNRVHPRGYDTHLYKDRNLIERVLKHLKRFHRIATRYGSLASHYRALFALVCCYLWLLWLLRRV